METGLRWEVQLLFAVCWRGVSAFVQAGVPGAGSRVLCPDKSRNSSVPRWEPAWRPPTGLPGSGGSAVPSGVKQIFLGFGLSRREVRNPFHAGRT